MDQMINTAINWAQINEIAFMVIVICSIFTVAILYSISMKITQIMKNVIDIDPENKNKIKDNQPQDTLQ